VHPQTARARRRMEIVEFGCAAANYPSPPPDENAWELRHCLVVRLLGESTTPMSLLAPHVSIKDTVLKERAPMIRKALGVDEVANIFFAVHYQYLWMHQIMMRLGNFCSRIEALLAAGFGPMVECFG
jgi:hypothetical protein